MTSRFSPERLEQMLEVMRERPHSVTAAYLAEKTGLFAASAQRAMAYLAQKGSVNRVFGPGLTGKHVRYYYLAEREHVLPPGVVPLTNQHTLMRRDVGEPLRIVRAEWQASAKRSEFDTLFFGPAKAAA